MAEDIRAGGGWVALGFDVVGLTLRVDIKDWYQQCWAIGCDGAGCSTGELESDI